MMDIVKKNLISIICGVVALAAVAVAFTMLTSKQGELQTQLDARKGIYDQLTGLLNKQRQLPILDPDKPNPEPLAGFPNEKVIDNGTKLTAAVEAESKAIVKAAADLNKHTPLEPGSLPEPGSTAGYRFRNRYLEYFPPGTATAAGPADPAAGDSTLNSQFAKALNAGMPPTANELAVEKDKVTRQIQLQAPLLPNGQFVNPQAVQNQIAQAVQELPTKMLAAVAENKKVYINPQTFLPWPNILQGNGQPDPVDIFGAQLMLWMQQDVVAAVNDANSGSKNIHDAVVKHLIRVTVDPNPKLPAGATAPGTDPDAAVTKDPTVSPTGRISNGMFDVYHIDVEADVDANRLPEFLRAFGKGRFMTVLWCDIRSIDNAVELAQGHDYGAVPMVNARAKVEVVYLRQWMRPLMPKAVRVKMGLPPDEAPATPDGGAAPADGSAAPAAGGAAAPATPADAAANPAVPTAAPAAPATPAPAPAAPARGVTESGGK